MTSAVRIIGIDPGLRNTGWGIIDLAGNNLSFVAAGTIKPKTELDLADRLAQIFAELTALITKYRPVEASVEETFVNKDARSTLKLGHARGIALVAPAAAGVNVAEYAANLVKKTIVGAGHAEKRQIRVMVKVLLPQAVFDSDDAADALAIAICHAHHRRVLRPTG